jgi:hypothetical protein
MLKNQPKKTPAIQNAMGFLALTIKTIEAIINKLKRIIMMYPLYPGNAVFDSITY